MAYILSTTGRGGFKGLNYIRHFLSRRERAVDEVVVDFVLLLAAQEDAVSSRKLATGSPDLLIVCNYRAGCLEMHYKRQVGLIKPHAEHGSAH